MKQPIDPYALKAFTDKVIDIIGRLSELRDNTALPIEDRGRVQRHLDTIMLVAVDATRAKPSPELAHLRRAEATTE